MDLRTTGLALVLIAVLLLTTAQLVIKSRLSAHGAIPLTHVDLFPYLWGLLRDWRLLAGLGFLVAAALCWYAGLSRVPLSLAFPFAALSYPLIFFGAVLLLHEPFSWQAFIGNMLIVAGVLMVAWGSKLPS
jgi:drug/metabolite transporter (DMT)-like permease